MPEELLEDIRGNRKWESESEFVKEVQTIHKYATEALDTMEGILLLNACAMKIHQSSTPESEEIPMAYLTCEQVENWCKKIEKHNKSVQCLANFCRYCKRFDDWRIHHCALLHEELRVKGDYSCICLPRRFCRTCIRRDAFKLPDLHEYFQGKPSEDHPTDCADCEDSEEHEDGNE